MTKHVNVLLVEHRRADALLIRHALAGFSDATFDVDVCTSLLQALAALTDVQPDSQADTRSEAQPDIIIAELNLSDSLGLQTFEQLHQIAPATPVLIMTTQTDHALGVRVVAAGAQDYLIKGEIESCSLGRLTLQAIARHKLRLDLARQLHEAETSLTRLRNRLDQPLYHRQGIMRIQKGMAD